MKSTGKKLLFLTYHLCVNFLNRSYKFNHHKAGLQISYMSRHIQHRQQCHLVNPMQYLRPPRHCTATQCMTHTYIVILHDSAAPPGEWKWHTPTNTITPKPPPLGYRSSLYTTDILPRHGGKTSTIKYRDQSVLICSL